MFAVSVGWAFQAHWGGTVATMIAAVYVAVKVVVGVVA